MDKPGTIYRLTNIYNGMSYIGQTSRDFQIRMNDYIRTIDWDDPRNNRPIMIAIKEFGWENFHKEVVLECPIDKLDENEIRFIMNENTLHPNGYNMQPGGKPGMDHNLLPDDIREFYLNNHHRKHNAYDLPPGVWHINCREGEEGFKVSLNGEDYNFLSAKRTMEEKLAEAMECYNVLKSGQLYHRVSGNKQFKDRIEGYDVPPGVKYRADKDGWEVHIKLGTKIHRKTFCNKRKYTKEEGLRLAIEYLNKLKDDYNRTLIN